VEWESPYEQLRGLYRDLWAGNLSFMDDFRLLIIADVHYAPGAAGADVNHPARRVDIALELLRRAVDDARHRGPVDAIALMGDMLNDGTALEREGGRLAMSAALADVWRVLDQAAPGVPVLAVPGNHDGDYGTYFAALGAKPGVQEIGGYRFVTIADRYATGDVATRSDENRQLISDLSAQRPRKAFRGRDGAPNDERQDASSDDVPTIVLQHSPMSPVIDDPYPYMLTNRREVMADYARASVLLCLSGHFHAGQPLSMVDGVNYFTCPALCQAPFGYAIATLRGREVRMRAHTLRFAEQPAVWDCHVHTEFAYCGEGTSAASAVERSREFGLAGVCLVEHAPQLYVSKDAFWAGRHVWDAGSWRSGTNRMHWYRQMVSPLRGPGVKVGLEVELDAAGDLTLLDEDRAWLDLLVGAVHFLHPDVKTLSDAEVTKTFLDVTEKLVTAGVDILAHPLRAIRWAKRPVPREIYPRLVALLAATGTAAEINHHHNTPDAEFFRQCIEGGVKIAFGSDTHGLFEAGNLGANLDMVRAVAGKDDVAQLLWRPN